MKEVKTTDIKKDEIGGITLGANMLEIEESDGFEAYPDNNYYEKQRGYDQFLNDRFMLEVDRVTNKIIGVRTLEDKDVVATKKGIKEGSLIEEVTASYGDDYYIFHNHEQGFFLSLAMLTTKIMSHFHFFP
ncbi:hypothetical protein [Shouchella patagoniensis]|uniref:hypothetical protein n=1 Tax=Shouchella patagoniensis TaxID=228576 RepID=UPI000995B19D|nr:hypothetical protein [Shouchella patagoniensis]